MAQHNWFEGGQWNATCDICGRAFKSSNLMRAWDNSMRCSLCLEARQPQDFVRAVSDNQTTPWSRPWVPQNTQIYTFGATTSSVLLSLIDAAQLPQPASGQMFIATLSDSISYEVVTISNVNLTTGVVTFLDRGLDGTIEKVWPVGTTLLAISGLLSGNKFNWLNNTSGVFYFTNSSGQPFSWIPGI